MPRPNNDGMVCLACTLKVCRETDKRCALTKIRKLRERIANIKYEARIRPQRKKYWRERYQAKLAQQHN